MTFKLSISQSYNLSLDLQAINTRLAAIIKESAENNEFLSSLSNNNDESVNAGVDSLQLTQTKQ